MNSFIIYIFIFFLGASIASFLQMYLDTDGENIRRGGSVCDGCKRNLRWWEVLPVLSWSMIFLNNIFKARLGSRVVVGCCGQVLNWKYLFGELALGLWFVGSIQWYGLENILAFNDVLILLHMTSCLIFGSIFFMLVMQDLNEMSVSARYLWIMCVVGIVGGLMQIYGGKNFEEIFPAIIIFSPFWVIYFLGRVLDREMIGEADPYIFTVLGVFFGVQFSISLFLYSVWVGSVWGVVYLYFVNKKFERNVRIPFLPIIFIACLIILITNYHIISIRDILLLNAVF